MGSRLIFHPTAGDCLRHGGLLRRVHEAGQGCRPTHVGDTAALPRGQSARSTGAPGMKDHGTHGGDEASGGRRNRSITCWGNDSSAYGARKYSGSRPPEARRLEGAEIAALRAGGMIRPPAVGSLWGSEILPEPTS